MRQLVDRIKAKMAEFIIQRDDLILVTRCSDPDAAAVSKILEGLDESSNSEFFWLVVDEFKDAASFSNACVQSFSSKFEAARLLLEKGGHPPWPLLPVELSNGAEYLSPVERVRLLITFSRSLLPSLSGCSVVWGFLPMKINNESAYAEFMSDLWRHEFPFPWCHHVRMIVRDTIRDLSLQGPIEKTPHTQTYTVDFSPAALRQAMEEEAGDDGVPLADRVNCALMLAGIDYSHGRYERAIQQYEIVHRYAATTQNPTLAALAINGIGETHRAQGETDMAGEFFQAALAPAAQAQPPPVPILSNLYRNLGELRHSEKRWEEAEVFLQGAAEFAVLLHDVDQRLHCWKLLGEAQYEQGKINIGLRTWFAGAVVAGKLEKQEAQRDFIGHIKKHYSEKKDEQGFKHAMARIEQEVSTEIANSDKNSHSHTIIGGKNGIHG